MKNRLLPFIFIALLSVSGYSQTKIKAMFYNLLNYSNSSISKQKTPHLKTILDEVQPDLFMVCELKNKTGSDYMFANAINASNPDFEQAPYKTGESPDTSLTQMVYYNAKKLILENVKVIPTGTRDINRYTFKIKTVNVDTNPIRIEVFVTHLKASRGSSNRQKRLSSIEDFVGELYNIPSNSYVLFAGDFNIYTSNEEGYIRLTSDQNPIEIIDPINKPCPPFPNDGKDYFDSNNYNSTYFWNNNRFADIHTQSTRTSNAGLIDDSGAGGGIDDRFDFIMLSKNFTTSSDLYYVNGSYKSIGNNGNCYNSYISNTNCSGTYSQNLRTALVEFSDHLPVILEIETPQNTLSTDEITSKNFLQNGNFISNKLVLDFKDLTPKSIQIYNIFGQCVINQSIKKSRVDIDVSQLSSGVFFVKVNDYKPIKILKF